MFVPRSGSLAALFAAALVFASAPPARAADAVSFQGKTVTMIIGYGAGGRIDVHGRIDAAILAQRLPGNPTVIVRNVLGADGIVALNVFWTQSKPDGLTVAEVGASQIDPLQFLKAKAAYDVAKLVLVGGNAHSGTALVMRKEAEPRLYDKTKPPVVMGALSAVRTGMQATLWGGEYLGWNAKWVLGYPQTKALTMAVEKGEIDMTSFSEIEDVKRLKATGKFMVVGQTGYLKDGKLTARAEYEAPLFADMIGDKIVDPVAERAFAYWRGISQIGEFLALPPRTPHPIVAAYRRAFDDAVKDPDFKAKINQTGEEFLPQHADALTMLLETIGHTPREALGYLGTIAKKQGLNLGE
jgi:putative tricarboxylic transport membrane protein